jgi:hypothetical protein
MYDDCGLGLMSEGLPSTCVNLNRRSSVAIQQYVDVEAVEMTGRM